MNSEINKGGGLAKKKSRAANCSFPLQEYVRYKLLIVRNLLRNPLTIFGRKPSPHGDMDL